MTSLGSRKALHKQLSRYLGSEMLRETIRCADRLSRVLPRPDDLSSNVVLVAYGGGKDSAYALAFTRAVQLYVALRSRHTFKMRVLTMRHAGMAQSVMDNIDRSYAALELYDDPDCELLLVDGDVIDWFDASRPLRSDSVKRNRKDILMAGHRTHADGRPTFCNACNFSVADSYMLAISYGDGVDVIVTGDSPSEQRTYARWIYSLAREMGVKPPASLRKVDGFQRMLATIEVMRDAYFADIHGAAPPSEAGVDGGIAARRVRFFSIFADTSYACGDHWELLTEFLGFQFDDAAFNFTESDCGNPALMAHLRGIKCERLYGTGYATGIQEYVDFAVSLMRDKQFPEHLIARTRQRYCGEDNLAQARADMDEYADKVFGLSEEQLVCMVYSPFAGSGAGLEDFLRREHPDLAEHADQVQRILAGFSDVQIPTDQALTRSIESTSGLSLDSLRQLYRCPAPSSTLGLIGLAIRDDPHKKIIRTRHTADGPEVREMISGR